MVSMLNQFQCYCPPYARASACHDSDCLVFGLSDRQTIVSAVP